MKYNWVIDCECGREVKCGWSSVQESADRKLFLKCDCGRIYSDVEALKSRGRWSGKPTEERAIQAYVIPFFKTPKPVCADPPKHTFQIVMPGANRPTEAK